MKHIYGLRKLLAFHTSLLSVTIVTLLTIYRLPAEGIPAIIISFGTMVTGLLTAVVWGNVAAKKDQKTEAK